MRRADGRQRDDLSTLIPLPAGSASDETRAARQAANEVFEQDRLDSLYSYGILDSEREPMFDRLAEVAAHICGTPMAAVTLVDSDRQWFKASVGLGGLRETPRAWSFCSDVVAAGGPVVVSDALADPAYCDNPLVTDGPQVRAYAGAPLISRDGLPLGALCVIDPSPHIFDARSLEMLEILAEQVVVLLESRRRDRGAGLLNGSVLAEARQPIRLRKALDEGELVAHYQPMVELISRRTYGFEALLRWDHPSLGILSPAAFMPLVETSALVVPIGRAVLNAAIAQAAELRRMNLPLPGGMAVNVASGQLARPGLASDVFAALERHGLPAQALAIEITETTDLPDSRLARGELNALADAGVHIVLDDFGMGWSNFSRLLDLPVTAIKIDRSITGSVTTDERAATIAAATMATALDLGLDVVAEGVESEAVRSHLIMLGCRWAQGWLFSAALPAASLPGLLTDNTGAPFTA
jgi:EAL domain-containing protein (putative c-di-GMP-specific phosphodiesterase class I)